MNTFGSIISKLRVKSLRRLRMLGILGIVLSTNHINGSETRQWSGIYPHLSYSNDQGECGTGAVVPWAERLWVITYSPHMPKGSIDKLYEIDTALQINARPESIGGTPANRMIHRESGQLFIGPYAIDAQRNVRTIPYQKMPGRPTGNARHLTDPAGKIYYATMEEGFYEVDVKTLAVKELYPDANRFSNHAGELLPGYHGKGFYSGQGRVIYANNGEYSSEAMKRPEIPSGCLAEWDGQTWKVIRRNQFTEVTGPGGIQGNSNPATDPIWSIGWDYRSLILMVRQQGQWRLFRLPKASHTYDGAHGWNTEWPRIREIGETDLLMTMHGMFWRFPAQFGQDGFKGIRPKSTYLKIIGDFCRWGNQVVLGCDDTAMSEFLNKRKAKGQLAAPGRSHSNLWFVEPAKLDNFGYPIGRGAVWYNDPVKQNEASDPFLFTGFEKRMLHLNHASPAPIDFALEIDRQGNGKWEPLNNITVPANGYKNLSFTASDSGEWIRIRPLKNAEKVTAWFTFMTPRMTQTDSALFRGIAGPESDEITGGILRVRGGDTKLTLQLAATKAANNTNQDVGYYEMNADMKLTRVNDPKTHEWLKKNAAIPTGVITVDSSSVLYIDDAGKRYRLPKGSSAFDKDSGPSRIDREVTTERDLFNCHGSFYELPAENAGGFAKIRPITTHNRKIIDYCSWRGMLVMTGTTNGIDNPHIIRSEDGQCSLWVGAVDDLWKFGKAIGNGGPWKDTSVQAGQISDPYLMTGYDVKTLLLSHNNKSVVTMKIEVDITGDGHWVEYGLFQVEADQTKRHEFPSAFQACWMRVSASTNTVASAQLEYR